ncbi:hypothetical protein ACQCT6_19975 [Cytobacillus gottheilii]
MIIEENSCPIYNHLFKNEVIKTVIIPTSSTAYTTMMTAVNKLNMEPDPVTLLKGESYFVMLRSNE